MTALECRHLHHEFSGRRTVTADFSYILARNDRVRIIGPNGMGNSTLFNILAGRIKARKIVPSRWTDQSGAKNGGNSERYEAP